MRASPPQTLSKPPFFRKPSSKVADRGCADTTAPLLLDSLEMDLLDAIPSVVTGVEDAVDIWGTSRTSLGRDNTNEPRASSGRVVGVAGAGALSERSIGIGEGEGDGEGCDSEMSIDLGSVSAPAEEPRLSSRSDLDDLSAKENCRSQEGGGLAWAAAAGVPATEASPDARGAQTPERARGVGGGGGSVDDDLEAHTPLPSLRLNRLCRRAVVLLTRSPACPDLVEFQTEPANRRTYDQMAPLLARAHMSFRDLHPESVGDLSRSVTRVQQIYDAAIDKRRMIPNRSMSGMRYPYFLLVPPCEVVLKGSRPWYRDTTSGNTSFKPDATQRQTSQHVQAL